MWYKDYPYNGEMIVMLIKYMCMTKLAYHTSSLHPIMKVSNLSSQKDNNLKQAKLGQLKIS